MLRAFLRAVFGRRDDKPGSPAPRWREAPTRTVSGDLGHGVVATMTFSTGPHGFVAVVGESHNQDVLRALAGKLGSDGVFTARLVPEPHNPHDANAVAICVDGDLAKVGYLAREVAKTYHPILARRAEPVTCPARLTGVGNAMIGVVLDFEEVRDALGLPRVSVDHGDIDDEAAAEYQRLNNANRLFVNETRPFERSDPAEAVARYRRALATLSECRELARVKGLEVYGFALNQTDALPIDRLTRCLVTIGKLDEATKDLDQFIEEFPQARDMTLLKAARERVNGALRARA
jgi:hypothetical protein